MGFTSHEGAVAAGLRYPTFPSDATNLLAIGLLAATRDGTPTGW